MLLTTRIKKVRGQYRIAEYPQWACEPCGTKHGSKKPEDPDWLYGKCEVCGKNARVVNSFAFGAFKEWFK